MGSIASLHEQPHAVPYKTARKRLYEVYPYNNKFYRCARHSSSASQEGDNIDVMANKIYRDRLINKIKYAVQESANAVALNHSGLTGRIRELSASSVFGPLLPAGFEIGTGKVCDWNGNLSGETDIVIYNKSILPPIMYSERDGVYPIEASFYSIEVKSKLTATEIQDAVRKGRTLIGLDYSRANPEDAKTNSSPVVFVLFAYASDLADSGMTELQRYAKYDATWQNDPVVKAICVIGKGYWWHNRELSGWHFNPPTESYDEVIDLVSGIGNTLAYSRMKNPRALLGEYLSEP